MQNIIEFWPPLARLKNVFAFIDETLIHLTSSPVTLVYCSAVFKDGKSSFVTFNIVFCYFSVVIVMWHWAFFCSLCWCINAAFFKRFINFCVKYTTICIYHFRYFTIRSIFLSCLSLCSSLHVPEFIFKIFLFLTNNVSYTWKSKSNFNHNRL